MFLADSDTYWSILTSPAHMLAELTVEVATGMVLYPILRWARTRWHREHDKAHH